jgi:hypothetical protein
VSAHRIIYNEAFSEKSIIIYLFTNFKGILFVVYSYISSYCSFRNLTSVNYKNKSSNINQTGHTLGIGPVPHCARDLALYFLEHFSSIKFSG